MKYPAASNGVSIGIHIIAPRGGELKPSSASGGLTYPLNTASREGEGAIVIGLYKNHNRHCMESMVSP